MAHHQQAYGYGDFSSSSSASGMQGFETSHHHGIFELQAGMEMLSMPSKHLIIAPNSDHNPWQQSNQDQQHLDRPSINQGLSLSLPHHHQFYQTYQLKTSMYLIPAQELLNEFCCTSASPTHKSKINITKQGESSNNSSSSPSWNQSALSSMDILELQKHKSRLLAMLEEVDKRYRRYCEQMRAVVSSFEAVAGQGSAAVYSALASKTISRHFRCVRDGIVSQVQATKKAMGEKDPVAPGTTKGETPRLKLLDQCLRQQKCFQQGGPLESHPWRPQRGLPERSVSILRAWLFEHFLHPYPSDVDKHILARQTGLSRSQVSNWFINARVRLWKPMVEEMYMEETKEQDSNQSLTGACDSSENSGQHDRNPNPSPMISMQVEQKPQMHHIDPGSLTSIINCGGRGPRAENFGVVDLDFASYNQECGGQKFGNGVSLTLGLQQHAAGGMSLSFSPTGHAHQQSMFYGRGEMDDCQPVQFSILDGDQGQNLPYRNLMGAQLLHDLAG